ncbi:MAG TPA: hypothetical protein ENO23_03535, partial [Alphaproteobacteria bacterium]|nr:hypothetical protein [Alphaproteobacteria bacterium]
MQTHRSAATHDCATSTTRAGFPARLAEHGAHPLVRDRVSTLQVNVGLRCNLACHHCHVESGPKRTERLSEADCARVLK